MVRRLSFVLCLIGCGDGGGGDEGGSGGMPGPPGGMAAPAGNGAVTGPVTFSRVFDEVFNAKGCTGSYCHGMGLGGLRMTMDDPAMTYANLVDAPAAGVSCGASGKRRVVPGDPDASLMLEKLNPMPSCGDTMPIGVKFDPDCLVPDNPSVCTTRAELALVRAWIAAGAKND